MITVITAIPPREPAPKPAPAPKSVVATDIIKPP